MSKIKRIRAIKQCFTLFEQYSHYFLCFMMQIMYTISNSTRHASVFACAPGGSFFINFPLMLLLIPLSTRWRQG